jgi:hypothetical protein
MALGNKGPDEPFIIIKETRGFKSKIPTATKWADEENRPVFYPKSKDIA